nr:hypothetical protein [Tanacetum cinerariifolium]
MHKAFPLLVRKFQLPEGTSHCLKKNATARRKVLPLPEVCTAIIFKEKPTDLDTMSLDDLYNHLKDINQINEDDMEEMDIKWNMALLSIRADKFWKKTGKKISIQGSDERGRRDTYKQGSKAAEQTPKELRAIDGVGWD